MGIEGPSSTEADEAVEVALEAFLEELNDVEIPPDADAVLPLQNFESFWDLENDKVAMLKVLMQKFGVNPETDKSIKVYSITGTPGDSDQGEVDVGKIDVEVFATNDPEIFLGKYTDADGDVDWAIRPLEVEE